MDKKQQSQTHKKGLFHKVGLKTKLRNGIFHCSGAKRNRAFYLTIEAGTLQRKSGEVAASLPKSVFLWAFAVYVKSVYPTGEVFANRPQTAFLCPKGTVHHEQHQNEQNQAQERVEDA